MPQICHKDIRTDSDNGGFLRVTEGTLLVEKTTPKGRFITVIISQVIVLIMARETGLEPATSGVTGCYHVWTAPSMQGLN